MTGEKLELVRGFRPFLDTAAVDIVHPDLLALRVQLTVLDRVHQLGSRRPGVVGSTRQVQPRVAGPDDGLEGGHGLTIGSSRPVLDPRLGKAWMSRGDAGVSSRCSTWLGAVLP